MTAGEIIIRPPTMDDLQAVVDMVNAAAVAEGGTADEAPEPWRAEWQSPDFTLATDAWVAVAPGGQIVGYEQIDVSDDGSPMAFDGYVHPAYKDQGIGTQLLRLMERRARAAPTGSDLRSPIHLRGSIEAANQAARRLFAAEGYQVIRHFWRMEIAMSAPPPLPLWPYGIVVRTFVPGQDERATHAAVEEAFADHWEHTPIALGEWVQRLTMREDFDPTLWFLAIDGDQIAGTALCYPRGDVLGWVRGLGVRREWRGRGLGQALLHQAFGAFYERGRATVGLGVDAQSLTGATRLYERAGMCVTEQYEMYEKVLEPA